MLFATQTDPLWIPTDAHPSRSAWKLGLDAGAPPAPIARRLTLPPASVQLHQSSSLRGWMEKAGFQPGLFNKDTSIWNKKLRNGGWDLTSAERAVQPLS